MRRQALVLAKNYSTPVSYWLALPLHDLKDWIDTNNVLIKEAAENRQNQSKR